MHRLSRSRSSWLLADFGVSQRLRRCVEALPARLSSWGLLRVVTSPGERALAAARSTFLAGVADIPGPHSAGLQQRIRAATGLRDLWHLRADVFALVSRALDQSTAQSRLAMLNRHFPTRSPGSGFAPLEPKARA